MRSKPNGLVSPGHLPGHSKWAEAARPRRAVGPRARSTRLDFHLRFAFAARFWQWLALLFLALTPTGCGSFIAQRMAQAPNSYPPWFGSLARVELAFNQNFLTNFPAHFTEVGPPMARLRYRIVEPADYHLLVTSTNRLKSGRQHFTFGFRTTIPGATNDWSRQPRGTIVLLHGYGLAQFALAPWAMRLAESGWRCVLVDLRGHGKSTGSRIYFGLQEAQDLSQLLDHLEHTSQVAYPLSIIGESYGATLALRWKEADSRIATVVAMAPYAELSNAVLNICRDYARWLPTPAIRAGLRNLPEVLRVDPTGLDPIAVMGRNPVAALFVAGGDDKIAPPTEVERLYHLSATGSEIMVVPQATHEALPYFFNDLLPPVLEWLNRADRAVSTSADKPLPTQPQKSSSPPARG